MTLPSTVEPAVRRAERQPARVLVVDSHAAVRLGILRLLEDHPQVESLTVGTTAEAAAAATEAAFDVAVVACRPDHDENGLTLARDLRSLPMAPRVLIYAANADHALTARAILAGADGARDERFLADGVAAAIADVLASRPARAPRLPRPVASKLDHPLRWEDCPLFHMWMAGKDDADIASAFGLSGFELERRRRAILDALAPAPAKPVVPREDGSWPLSYQRALRLRGQR